MFLISVPMAAAEPLRELRVLCWNLHHGVGEDGKLDLVRIADLIRAQRPDLVALQEVDQRCRRSGSVDQTAELARLTGMHGVFGKAMDHDGGEYGQAILSRHRIAGTKVHRLPGDGEPRIAFAAEIEAGGERVTFVTVHLDHRGDERRVKQAETLAKVLAATAGPVVLAGDFNDVPGSPALSVFGEPWKPVVKREPVATHPAGRPEKEIDHLFVRGLEPVGKAVVLPEAVASDHRPVSAVVGWKRR